MSAQPFQQVGWCPGALRPMESGDGFILRVKPQGGILGLDIAEAVGTLSLRYGNGLLDLTGRANLQIRGVAAALIQPSIVALSDLGVLDASPEAEAVRNIVASPLAGLDATARSDAGRLVAAVAYRFAQDAALHGLPAKWSILVDDGGVLPLSDVVADLRFEAVTGTQVQVGLGNDAHRGICAPDDVAEVAATLASMAIAEPTPKRMQALVEAQGAPTLLSRAGLALASPPSVRRSTVSATDLIGRQNAGEVAFFGVAPPFGSLDAQDLIRLVGAARAAGAHDLRLTPWRVMLVTGVLARRAPVFAAALRETALIADAADSRLAVSACVGQPACRRGTVSTRRDASRLARYLDRHAPARGPLVHLSGCSKGCAQGATTPWTLVGHEGLYDVVRNGRAGDPPLARGLSIGEAATWISQDPGTRVS